MDKFQLTIMNKLLSDPNSILTENQIAVFCKEFILNTNPYELQSHILAKNLYSKIMIDKNISDEYIKIFIYIMRN